MAIRKIVSRSIGTDVIAAEDLAANSVTVAEIQDDAVTSAKIDSTSTGMALADLAVDTDTLYVDATNDSVGINISNPGDYYSGSNSLVVSGGLSIRDQSGVSRLEFVDGTSGSDAYVGNIVYVHSGDYMRFNAGVSQRLRIDADGLKFGSDSAAANALDDYEEGTFTPTISVEGASGSLTPSTTWWAKYTKIGRKVHITMQVQWDNVMANGGNSNGAILFGGLPYSYANTNNGGEANLARGGYWGSNNAPGSIFSRELVIHTFYNSSGTSSGYVKYLASNTDRGGYMRVGGGPLSNAGGTSLRMEIEFSYLTN
jgi:hypothetical protein